MICVLPARIEFGHKIMFHAPAVHAMPRPVTVCVEPGEEALYPGCTHVVVERAPDRAKRPTARLDKRFVEDWKRRLAAMHPGCKFRAPDYRRPGPLERFVPQPVTRYGISADIVLCPRKREFAPERNWPYWRELSERLEGRIFAAGIAEASETEGAYHDTAWNYERELDATIEAMLSARLVIASDTGLAHLAAFCGRPLVIVCAGKYVDPSNRWPVEMWRYDEDNHTGSPIVLADAWHDVSKVLEHACELAAA